MKMRAGAGVAERRNRSILKWLLYGLLFLAATLLQTTVLVRAELFGTHPLLIPGVVVAVAMFEGAFPGAVFGFFAGLLCDAIIPPAEVFFAIILMLCGFTVGKLCQIYFQKRLVTALMWTAIFFIVYELLYFCVFYLIPGRAGLDALYTVALPETAYSLALTPVFYPAVRSVYRRLGKNNM